MMLVVSTMAAPTRSWVTVGGVRPWGVLRRVSVTSLTAAEVLAKISTANSERINGRALRGTGPGFAATASSTRTTTPSTTGTTAGGPSRIAAGTRTCGRITRTRATSGQR